VICKWCDADIPGRFPERCAECGAEYDHEADYDSEGAHPYVVMRKKGDPAKYWADPHGAVERSTPTDADRASFHRETLERADRADFDSMGGWW